MPFQETVKYKDLDGNDVEDTFYFNISKAEMTKMNISTKGGMKAYFEKILREDDRAKIIETFDQILLASVGRRSENGRLFLKTPEVVNEFRYSGAYEVVFLKLLTDADYSSKFVNNVLPADIIEKINTGKPVAVDLPSTPAPTPDLSTAAARMAAMASAPDFSRMTAEDFLDWQRRQNNPLGL